MASILAELGGASKKIAPGPRKVLTLPAFYPIILDMDNVIATATATWNFKMTFRDGRVRYFKTWNGANRARRPGVVIVMPSGRVINTADLNGTKKGGF
jgi:hypothetical protein